MVMKQLYLRKKIDLYRMTHQICIHFNKESACKGHLFIFNHCIDMRTSVSLSISCRKNVFLLKFSNKNTFFPHEMDKLMVVLMSIKRLNKERRPLVTRFYLWNVVSKLVTVLVMVSLKVLANLYFGFSIGPKPK